MGGNLGVTLDLLRSSSISLAHSHFERQFRVGGEGDLELNLGSHPGACSGNVANTAKVARDAERDQWIV